jgi:hypothetical protein
VFEKAGENCIMWSFKLFAKSNRIQWAGHVARMEAKGNAYRILVRKPDEKKPLGTSRRMWEDNINMDLKRVRMRWYGLD